MRDEETQIWSGRRTEQPPNFDEAHQSAQIRGNARREARSAVLAQSAGKSRQEIRQLLIGELRSRELAVPPEPILDADIEFIARGATKLAGLRYMARMLTGLRATRREIAAMFKDAQTLKGPSGKDVYLVMPDRSRPMIDVVLNSDANQQLKALSDTVPVSLEPEKAAGHHAVSSIVVYVGAHPVGTLSPQDGLSYMPALKAAQRRDQTLMVMGVVNHATDGTLRMQVNPAGTA